MLEIGLGCDMNYEPSASVALWKKLFPKADLGGGECNATCVELATKQGKLDCFSTPVGDMGNNNTLDEWISNSGGDFDVIIDDGGHQNCCYLELGMVILGGFVRSFGEGDGGNLLDK